MGARFYSLYKKIGLLFGILGFHTILGIGALGLFHTAMAADAQNVQPPAAPLSVDQAFSFHLKTSGSHTLIATWRIQPGYYLYRDRIQITASEGLKLGQINLPPTHAQHDFPGLGSLYVYLNSLSLPIPLMDPPRHFSLTVHYQGCSAAGYCYPPVTKSLIGGFDKTHGLHITTSSSSASSKNTTWASLISFLGLGVLLSLSPCVLPMIPIVSAILIGQTKTLSPHHPSSWHPFLLSCNFVVGSALIYAAAGFSVAWLGSTLQMALQKPWLIALSGIILIAMAFSLFGFYSLELPGPWQTKITAYLNRQKKGTYWGALCMGALSALLLSPCLTAPLVAALGYIAQTGKVFLGALNLFLLGIGMGTPLLLLGIFGSHLLPKLQQKTSFLRYLQYVIGLFILGVGLFLIAIVLSKQLSLVILEICVLLLAFRLGLFKNTPPRAHWAIQGLLWTSLIYIFLLLLGFSRGPIPLPLHPPGTDVVAGQLFIRVESLSGIQKELARARRLHKPVLLDFYSKWCLNCYTLESVTFQNAAVKKKLQRFHRLRIDITPNNNNTKTVMNYFQVYGPPTLLFFTSSGQEVSGARVVGSLGPSALSETLASIQ